MVDAIAKALKAVDVSTDGDSDFIRTDDEHARAAIAALTEPRPCRVCSGTGTRATPLDENGVDSPDHPCPDCHGSGSRESFMVRREQLEQVNTLDVWLGEAIIEGRVYIVREVDA